MRVPDRVPERTVQADIVKLLTLIGFEVWTLGTTRRRGDHPGTMQSAGLPDLSAGGRGRCLMVEVKARGGQLRPAQVRFQAMCQAAGVDHVAGGLDDVVAWLQTAIPRGWLVLASPSQPRSTTSRPGSRAGSASGSTGSRRACRAGP